MNKIILYLTALLIFCFIGCSIQSPTDTIDPNQSSGKIVLKIDRGNAPSSVTTVVAYLTKQGYDTLTGTMNLLSSTSADITFQSVLVGLWHLRVEAKNDSGVVLYAGETDVLVQENFTTQVNLTLVSTGTGVGSIYIIVNWGTNISTWVDYYNNPILTGNSSVYEFGGVRHPKIIFDGQIYKMWFTSLSNSGVGYISYATSQDAINWVRGSNLPVLYPGSSGSWDSHAVTPGVIIKEGNIFKMYYNGVQSNSGAGHIGLATSTDGSNWIKYPNPVLFGTSGWEYQIAVTDLIKVESTYYLFYSGNGKIGLATSVNGVDWIRSNSNPVLVPTQMWEGTGVVYASVIKDGSLFKMIYMNTASTGFGSAISSDLINWTKEATNPIFRLQNTSGNWTTEIAYPYWRKFGAEYRIYYTGYKNGKSLIGMTRKFN